MKSVIYFIFLFLFLNPIIAQKIVFKSNSEVKTEVVYNLDGKPTKKTLFTSDTTLQWQWSYDEAGRCIEEIDP